MNFQEEIHRALRDAIEEAQCLSLVAAHCAHTFGWSGTLREWRARVSRWGNPSDPHRYPAEAIPIIRMCSGRDPFTSIILRSGMAELEALPDRIKDKMRKCEPQSRRERRSA